MKKSIIALALSVCFSSSVLAKADPQIQTCPDNIPAVAEQAYIELFPLLEQARWMQEDMMTKWGYVRGTNEFHHQKQLINHHFAGVVGPNNDTLYSIVTVDVSQGDVKVTVPEVKDRYSSVLMLDAMHYQVGVEVNKPGSIGFIRAGTTQTSDADRVYTIDSDLMYFMVRTEVAGPHDLTAAHQAQEKFSIEGKSRAAADIFPRQDVNFIERANSLIKDTDLSEANIKNMACYKQIGLYGEPKEAVLPFLIKAKTKGDTYLANNEDKLDMAYFNTEALTPKENHQQGRAIANQIWHLAFSQNHAHYPLITQDAQGEALSGDAVYSMTFNKDQPTNAFWSMTTYNMDKTFIPNEQMIYKIGDKTAKLNPDGKTITVTYAAEKPRGALNWQPILQGSDFYIGVRMYEATADYWQGKWEKPTPVKVK